MNPHWPPKMGLNLIHGTMRVKEENTKYTVFPPSRHHAHTILNSILYCNGIVAIKSAEEFLSRKETTPSDPPKKPSRPSLISTQFSKCIQFIQLLMDFTLTFVNMFAAAVILARNETHTHRERDFVLILNGFYPIFLSISLAGRREREGEGRSFFSFCCDKWKGLKPEEFWGNQPNGRGNGKTQIWFGSWKREWEFHPS